MSEEQRAGGAGAPGVGFSMSTAEFRDLGHGLVDAIADFYASLPERRLTSACNRSELRALLPHALPETGRPAGELFSEVMPLLFDHSLHSGHPRFFGYIYSSGAPLGALADFLAAAVNANVGKWDLAPIASEIETQTIEWLADLIGFESNCGGIMVSGGNSANLHGFLAARRARAPWDSRAAGIYGDSRRLTAYVSAETHTWVEKAAEVAGLGASAVRWIRADPAAGMDTGELRRKVGEDRRAGRLPFLVVGTAGTVATGAIDPLRELAAFCREEALWFHVDGAYGAPAACLPEAPPDLRALELADSVALDPHKWLYNPLEAACILTRDPKALRNAFEFRPSYYRLDEDDSSGVDYYQHGLQNSRGFRALKVWLGLRAVGRAGYIDAIRGNIALARYLYESLDSHPELEARSLGLSIVTFRYVPRALAADEEGVRPYLNRLNETLAASIQKGGEAFVSNAEVDGDYLLRICIVNFRTTRADIDATVALVSRLGALLDRRLRGLAD